jgi:hypothetical protein
MDRTGEVFEAEMKGRCNMIARKSLACTVGAFVVAAFTMPAAAQYVYAGPGTAFWYRVDSPGVYGYNTGTYFGNPPFASGEVYGITPPLPESQTRIYMGPSGVVPAPQRTPPLTGLLPRPLPQGARPYGYGIPYQGYAPYGYRASPYGSQYPGAEGSVDGSPQGYRPSGRRPRFADPYATHPRRPQSADANAPARVERSDAGGLARRPQASSDAEPRDQEQGTRARRRRVRPYSYGYGSGFAGYGNTLISPHRFKAEQGRRRTARESAPTSVDPNTPTADRDNSPSE